MILSLSGVLHSFEKLRKTDELACLSCQNAVHSLGRTRTLPSIVPGLGTASLAYGWALKNILPQKKNIWYQITYYVPEGRHWPLFGKVYYGF